jgi:N-acetylglucosaminyldiphosphoundecaprenol N-acetyl-beta-D-mannosaminyltransferase
VGGVVTRAPVWVRKTGMEWLYRFLREPRRLWKRYLIGNLQFVSVVLRQRLSSRDVTRLPLEASDPGQS